MPEKKESPEPYIIFGVVWLVGLLGVTVYMTCFMFR